MKKYAMALHVFRRDLRLDDNTALLFALRSARVVIPCFIFDPRQTSDHPYRSDRALQFMMHSLAELDRSLRGRGSRLFVFEGCAEDVISQLLTAMPIDIVTVNRDYTPFARKRDDAIGTVCAQNDTMYEQFADTLLTEPEMVHKDDGTPYTVFTPFARRARDIHVAQPHKNDHTHFYNGEIAHNCDLNDVSERYTFKKNDMCVIGGREEGKKLLRAINTLSQYEQFRDVPYRDHTSRLSAHHKFGTVSIRETYHMITQYHGAHHPMITQLYWRDFFTHIAFHHPHIFGHAFRRKFEVIPWTNDVKQFNAWKVGMTGFPIVDAGMRELNTTGYMHNRVRMITASFLVKDLLIDWRWGEKYFAQQLVDYDPSVNNGNWQWIASTGCDAQPYFRIFNPWRQQEKYDPDCVYIKKWIPALQDHHPKEIHQYAAGIRAIAAYPPCIVDHDHAVRNTKSVYRSVTL